MWMDDDDDDGGGNLVQQVDQSLHQLDSLFDTQNYLIDPGMTNHQTMSDVLGFNSDDPYHASSSVFGRRPSLPLALDPLAPLPPPLVLMSAPSNNSDDEDNHNIDTDQQFFINTTNILLGNSSTSTSTSQQQRRHPRLNVQVPPAKVLSKSSIATTSNSSGLSSPSSPIANANLVKAIVLKGPPGSSSGSNRGSARFSHERQPSSTDYAPTSEDTSEVSESPRRVIRRTTVACKACKASKQRCEGDRPCQRCVKKGIADSCEDCTQLKRGRKAQKGDSSSVGGGGGGGRSSKSPRSSKRMTSPFSDYDKDEQRDGVVGDRRLRYYSHGARSADASAIDMTAWGGDMSSSSIDTSSNLLGVGELHINDFLSLPPRRGSANDGSSSSLGGLSGGSHGSGQQQQQQQQQFF